jgi:hypothetical protein
LYEILNFFLIVWMIEFPFVIFQLILLILFYFCRNCLQKYRKSSYKYQVYINLNVKIENYFFKLFFMCGKNFVIRNNKINEINTDSLHSSFHKLNAYLLYTAVSFSSEPSLIFRNNLVYNYKDWCQTIVVCGNF